MNRREIEELKVEFLQGLTACVHGLAYGLPYLVLAYAVSLVIHSTLSEPFSLTCKTTPTEQATRPLKKRLPSNAPVFLSAQPEETPAPIIKIKPVELD